jgi:hypothetical protein
MGPEEQGILPKFDYHLDESDPDVLVLRRQDGSFVAAFSAEGATKEGIVQAAKEDYARLLEENGSVSSSDLGEDDARKSGSARAEAGRSRRGATSGATGADDRARGDRKKAAGKARRDGGPVVRPPRPPVEGGEQETGGRQVGRAEGGPPSLPPARAEPPPVVRHVRMRWHNPKLGGYEWREVPQTDEQAIEALAGSPYSAQAAETYRDWREIGAPIEAALIRAGEEAEAYRHADEEEEREGEDDVRR